MKPDTATTGTLTGKIYDRAAASGNANRYDSSVPSAVLGRSLRYYATQSKMMWLQRSLDSKSTRKLKVNSGDMGTDGNDGKTYPVKTVSALATSNNIGSVQFWRKRGEQ